MPGFEKISSSVKVFETALNAKDPFKELFKMAEEYIKAGDLDSLHNVDVMLISTFIEYLRNGNIDDLRAFLYDVLAFTDSRIGDRLKKTEEGKCYFYRWEHFHDLCDTAIENYDPQLMKRFVESRKYGKELLSTLYKSPDGIRHKELSERLGISPQYLSKLLKEFQQQDLVTRNSRDKVSIVKLGISGRAFVNDNENCWPTLASVLNHENEEEGIPIGKAVTDYLVTDKPAARIASRKAEYITGEPVPPTPEFGPPKG